jgi:hypothetical protein
MKAPVTTPFDYAICSFGLLGAVWFLGMKEILPPFVLFLWGLFSTGICFFSSFALLTTVLTHFSPRAEPKIYLAYLAFNIIPSLAFVFWVAEKTQVPTPPGCC